MTSLVKIKHAPFALAGGGIGCALLAGALGWHVARPVGERVALPEFRQPAVVERAPQKAAAPKAFLADHRAPSTAQAPKAAAPPALPQPAAPRPVVPVPAKAVEQVFAVNPALPGNFLVVSGQRVAIQQRVGGESAALDVVITPVVGTSASAQEESELIQNQSGRASAGFTREQEQFRAKWGWAAYNAASRAATWSSTAATP